MDLSIDSVTGLEGTVSLAIRLVGTAIEAFGVFIIVAGIAWSTLRGAFSRLNEVAYDRYKTSIGRSLLLGLEVLVAADIVKTVALDLNFTSLGLLAGLVVVRTFLSWSLFLEIEGHWPWQRGILPMRTPREPSGVAPDG
jgi:uncharacterized membrane protein